MRRHQRTGVIGKGGQCMWEGIHGDPCLHDSNLCQQYLNSAVWCGMLYRTLHVLWHITALGMPCGVNVSCNWCTSAWL